MPFVKFKRADIYFEHYGKGKPLLLLHGFLGSCKIFNRITRTLSKNFHVIVIDLPGHGKSENLGYFHSMELMAESVKAVCDELKVKDFFVAGHSMGAYVALSLTQKNPEMVKGICLINSIPFADEREKIKDRDRAISAIKSNHNIYVTSAIKNLFSPKQISNNKKPVNSAIKIAEKTCIRGIIAALEGMKLRSDFRKLIHQNPEIFFSLMGSDDQVYSSPVKKELKKIILKNNYFVLEKSGHMSVLEEPGEVIFFLKKIFINQRDSVT
ncbi:MAG: alpha/beta fold hydrolase [Bacteroidota bacterium]|jgi:pimeloyl-ACP methyl ester carboxylesterase